MSRISDLNIPADGSDVHDAVQAFVSSCAGDVCEFDTIGTYMTGRINVPSGTCVVMNPGVSFRKRHNAAGLFQIANVDGVRFHANGAQFYGDDFAGSTAFGHTIYFLGATDCKTFGLHVDSASPGGGGKDGIYIGAGANDAPCRNVQLFDGKYLRGKRNNISVVAGIDTLIDGFEAAHSTGAPGCGIDVEANKYEMVGRTVIRNGKAHSNQNSGIVHVFGVGTTLDNVDLFGNGKYGFGVGSGGTQFAENVFRPNVDMIGVIGFDMATGAVLVAAQPPIGTPINFSRRNGAQIPPQFSASYYVVSRYIGTNGVILGRSVGNSEVTGLSLPGAGVMSADPYESDIRLRAFVDGQSEGCEIRRSRIYGNGTQGLLVGGAGKFFGYDCDIYGNGSNQVQIQYTRDVELLDFQARGENAGYAGIVASGGGGYLRIRNSVSERTRGCGMSFAEWTGAELTDNKTIDCAEFEAGSIKAGLALSSMLAPKVVRHRATQRADNTKTLFGIYADGMVKGGEFCGNDCTGAGTTSANALRVPAGSACSNNIGRDGTLVP